VADGLEKALLERSVQSIGGVRSALEVGCGTGHFTRWLEGLGLNVLGVDISPFMLREARRLWPTGSLIRASSTHLPVRDGAFDCVAYITCFEYMKETREQVLREARRTARRGMIFGLMNAWSLTTLRRKAQLALGLNPFYKTAHFYSIREMKRLLDRILGKGRHQFFSWSTLFPRPIPVKQSSLPLGSFLVLGVRFRE